MPPDPCWGEIAGSQNSIGNICTLTVVSPKTDEQSTWVQLSHAPAINMTHADPFQPAAARQSSAAIITHSVPRLVYCNEPPLMGPDLGTSAA